MRSSPAWSGSRPTSWQRVASRAKKTDAGFFNRLKYELDIKTLGVSEYFINTVALARWKKATWMRSAVSTAFWTRREAVKTTDLSRSRHLHRAKATVLIRSLDASAQK